MHNTENHYHTLCTRTILLFVLRQTRLPAAH